MRNPDFPYAPVIHQQLPVVVPVPVSIEGFECRSKQDPLAIEATRLEPEIQTPLLAFASPSHGGNDLFHATSCCMPNNGAKLFLKKDRNGLGTETRWECLLFGRCCCCGCCLGRPVVAVLGRSHYVSGTSSIGTLSMDMADAA